MPSLPTANRVTHWETHRGRNNEFDKTEAGTATITLMNRDGLFDPLNAGSVYVTSGNVLPLRQVRITQNTPDDPSTFHDIFTGYVEGWEYERRGPRHALTTVQCVDGFELLQQSQVTITASNPVGGHYFAEQHVNDRINAALGFAGWPAARKQIFTGNVYVQEENYAAGTSMLEVIQDAGDAEFPGVANFYMDRTGRACFRGRFFRLDPFNVAWDGAVNGSRKSNLYKFGDSLACEANPLLLPLYNLTWTFDKTHLYNIVSVIPDGMDPLSWASQRVTDSVQIAAYGPRDLTIANLNVLAGDGPPVQTGSEEAKRFSLYYLANYKFPIVRANMLEVHSKFEDDRIWDFLTGVELGDVVELYTQNPGGGGFDGEQFFVDGIHNVVDAEGDWPQWESQFDLTPRGRFDSFPDPFETLLRRPVQAEYAGPPRTEKEIATLKRLYGDDAA